MTPAVRCHMSVIYAWIFSTTTGHWQENGQMKKAYPTSKWTRICCICQFDPTCVWTSSWKRTKTVESLILWFHMISRCLIVSCIPGPATQLVSLPLPTFFRILPQRKHKLWNSNSEFHVKLRKNKKMKNTLNVRECLNHPTRWLQPHARRFNYYEVDRSENRAIELHRKMTSRSMFVGGGVHVGGTNVFSTLFSVKNMLMPLCIHRYLSSIRSIYRQFNNQITNMQTSRWDLPASCMSSQPLWSPQPPDFFRQRFLQLCWIRVCVKCLSKPRWSGQRVPLLPHSVHEFCSNTQPRGTLWARTQGPGKMIAWVMRRFPFNVSTEVILEIMHSSLRLLWSSKIRGPPPHPPRLVASLQCTQIIAPNLEFTKEEVTAP